MRSSSSSLSSSFSSSIALNQAKAMNRKLVCVKRTKDIGVNTPLVHSAVDTSFSTYQDRISFYETLNAEVAYFVSCYDKVKPISLKTFFIDEAHATCEWLVHLMETDSFVTLMRSKLNMDDMYRQRDSIRNIRNELHALLSHPAFLSVSMTPTRILRLPDDVDIWSTWQTRSFENIIGTYSKKYPINNASTFTSKPGHGDGGGGGGGDGGGGDGGDDDDEKIYCTEDTSIVFIYNKDREQHKKPLTSVPLRVVVKKYRNELKDDPSFVAFSKRLQKHDDDNNTIQEKKKNQQQQQQQQQRPLSPLPLSPQRPLQQHAGATMQKARSSGALLEGTRKSNNDHNDEDDDDNDDNDDYNNNNNQKNRKKFLQQKKMNIRKKKESSCEKEKKEEGKRGITCEKLKKKSTMQKLINKKTSEPYLMIRKSQSLKDVVASTNNNNNNNNNPSTREFQVDFPIPKITQSEQKEEKEQAKVSVLAKKENSLRQSRSNRSLKTFLNTVSRAPPSPMLIATSTPAADVEEEDSSSPLTLSAPHPQSGKSVVTATRQRRSRRLSTVDMLMLSQNITSYHNNNNNDNNNTNNNNNNNNNHESLQGQEIKNERDSICLMSSNQSAINGDKKKKKSKKFSFIKGNGQFMSTIGNTLTNKTNKNSSSFVTKK